MENDLQSRLGLMEQKIDAIFVSVEKTRKYFLWTTIITVVIIVLPFIAMLFVVPMFMSTYSGLISGSALGI